MTVTDRGGDAATSALAASVGLTDADLLAMYRTVALARAVDERMWILNRAGRIPFVISGQGHEGAQVGLAWPLRQGHDWVAPYYRSIATCLAFGMTARDIMLAQYAKAIDPSSGGRQMPGHYGSREHHMVSVSSPVATQILHAVGIALAAKIRKIDQVAVAIMGEGSSNQGDVHEALNFAAIHKLPFVFIVENNGYAICVPAEKELRSRTWRSGRPGTGSPASSSTGPTCSPATRPAARRSTARGPAAGPTLIEAKVTRLTAHRSDDQQTKYRSAEELEPSAGARPAADLPRAAARRGRADRRARGRARRRDQAVVEDATDFAEGEPTRPVTAVDHVYAETGRARRRRRGTLGPGASRPERALMPVQDVHRGDPRRHGRGDAARRADHRAGRGRRQEGRRVPRDRRPVGRVRRRPRHRHAADRVDDRRGVDRRRDQRAAPGRRDPVRRLHPPGVQPDRVRGGPDALPLEQRRSACRW